MNAPATPKPTEESTPLTVLKGIGPRKAEQLARIGIESVQDLLFHLPSQYQDRTRVVPMGDLWPGRPVVIEGEVQSTRVHFGKRRALLVVISDGSGLVTLRFFHFSARQKDNLAKGTPIRCFAEVRRGPTGLEMIHPEYQLLDEVDETQVEDVLTPIYPATEGLQQVSIRGLCEQALQRLRDGLAVKDWLPESLLKAANLPTLPEALLYLHGPPPDAPLAMLAEGQHPAQRRLAFEELLAHHLSMRRLRSGFQVRTAPQLQPSGELSNALLASLPFELTGAQQQVMAEIRADIVESHPMLRLVQGDVGSGKTIVAALAALQAVEAGYQAVVMAPTELLAEQHLRSFSEWLLPLGLNVAWLAGKTKGKQRRTVLEQLREGTAHVIVGTHALFQDDVEFAELGLVVVDEQHRFGVHQRLALREKGRDGITPHQLIMTATPIPRTLSMTAYADLDCSVIDELPPGRTPVTTVVIPDSRREEVVQRVQAACADGRQAYWVCTLVEESEALQAEAAEDTAASLAEALPQVKIGLVHGRMKAQEKELVMGQFESGQLDLLVATTVIEVGVNVPNASLMIIENAERLGLAQLHQLRGRVGRGATQSHCVLMYHPPLSRTGKSRLATLRETNDGFEIARKDLELRGPGELLGTRQTGLAEMKIADVVRDEPLIPEVHRLAEQLLLDYPSHIDPLIRRWLGEGTRYGDV